MDFSSFKLDIDELIKEFAEGELKTFADMKRVWADRKFSYIFEALPSTNLALYMQSMYSHCISYMIPTNSLSQKLGGLYCLYCLYETQPFKPPFKIYLSLGELRRLKALVIDAKGKGIKVVSVLVKKMLEKNTFLFGYISMNEYSDKQRIKELVDVQNACVQKMHDKLLADSDIERYLHMDMGMELDLELLMKMATEYAGAKGLAMREASKVVDVQDMNHIAQDRPTIGDELTKIVEEWTLAQQTGSSQHFIVPRLERENTQQEPTLPLPTTEPQLGDDVAQHGGFLQLLMGNESPQLTSDDRHSVPEEDDFEYVKDLEHQLFDDDEF